MVLFTVPRLDGIYVLTSNANANANQARAHDVLVDLVT